MFLENAKSGVVKKTAVWPSLFKKEEEIYFLQNINYGKYGNYSVGNYQQRKTEKLLDVANLP